MITKRLPGSRGDRQIRIKREKIKPRSVPGKAITLRAPGTRVRVRATRGAPPPYVPGGSLAPSTPPRGPRVCRAAQPSTSWRGNSRGQSSPARRTRRRASHPHSRSLLPGKLRGWLCPAIRTRRKDWYSNSRGPVPGQLREIYPGAAPLGLASLCHDDIEMA